MRLKRLLTLVLMLTSLIIVPSCSWLQRPVYVPPGVKVELAEPTQFIGWVTDKETGVRSRRIVKAQAGWLIGRPKGDKDGK